MPFLQDTTIPSRPDFDKLPDKYREELLASEIEKYNNFTQQAIQYKKMALDAEAMAKGAKAVLKWLGYDAEEEQKAFSSSYPANGSISQKVLYFLREPGRYSYVSLLGTADLVSLISNHEREYLTRGKQVALMRLVSQTLSKLHASGKLTRYIEPSNNTMRYATPEMFDDVGQPKPNVARLFEGLVRSDSVERKSS